VPFRLSALFQQSTAVAVNRRLIQSQRSNPMSFCNELTLLIALKKTYRPAAFAQDETPKNCASIQFLIFLLCLTDIFNSIDLALGALLESAIVRKADPLFAAASWSSHSPQAISSTRFWDCSAPI
jgi:hypothetical protein